MGKKNRDKSATTEIKLKTEEQRRNEIDIITGKLKLLEIADIVPQEIKDKIEVHIKNGTNYYLKHPWPEMKRDIELILNNKISIQNKMNLLYKSY